MKLLRLIVTMILFLSVGSLTSQAYGLGQATQVSLALIAAQHGQPIQENMTGQESSNVSSQTLQNATTNLPPIRLILRTTSASVRTQAVLQGCVVVHRLINATALACPPSTNLPNAEPDPILHILDLSADKQIRSDQVWSQGITGSGVTVAVLDTGIDSSHGELSSSIVGGLSFVSYTTSYSDDNGHGTFVSGIITSDGSSDINSKGVAYNANVWMGKVCDNNGSCATSDIAAGIEYIVNNHIARIISISIGGGGTTAPNCDSSGDLAVQDVNWAFNNGVVSVIASGNDYSSTVVNTPACASKAIAVGAVDSSDTLASFSNQGNALEDHGLVAPGVSIYSTAWNWYWPWGGYTTGSGTSAATPHVSATIALMLQNNPVLNPDMIRSIVFNSANCLSQRYGNCPNTQIGHGRVDALNAFFETIPPWASIVSPSGWLHGTVTLTATAGDPYGYVVRVRFLWTPDKANGPYWIIGDDTNGADGWSIPWDCGGSSNNDPSVWVAAVALDNFGLESDWSWSSQFGVDQTPPSTPSLSSPSNGLGITNPTPTFTWNSASDSLSGVASYTFQIDTSASFNSGNLRTVTGITSTNYTPSTPLAIGTWYWRVGALDNAGNQGSFSSYWSVTVETLVTTTVTLTQTSTSYLYATMTATTTSYSSTATSTSTVPTATTVVLVPLTITSTAQSTQYLTPTATTTVTNYTDTQILTSTIPTTVALVASTVTSIVQSIQYLTSILSTTTTSYTSTQTSASTVVVPTTVVLVPLTATSTVQSTQSLSSTATTTVTSYTSTATLTSTVPTATTVVLLPTTTTSTVQSTQFLTSTVTTTTTNYTDTVTSTSTSVVYTTVTVSQGVAGSAGSIPLTYLSLFSLLAMTVGHKVVTSRPKKTPKIRPASLPPTS